MKIFYNWNLFFGLYAEILVIVCYFFMGYKIIKHRYKSKLGEIDIILKKFDLIVFCEVKARVKFFDDDILVKNNQKNRIKKSAEYFLLKNEKFSKYHVRMDLALVQPFSLPKFYKNWI